MAPHYDIVDLTNAQKLDALHSRLFSTHPYLINRSVHRVKHLIWDTTPILPVLATIILAITVFLLILFRQSPGIVAGTVGACLLIIGVYLFLTSLSVAPKFE